MALSAAAHWIIEVSGNARLIRPSGSRLLCATPASTTGFEAQRTLEVDHLPHTQLARNAFTRGMPERGVELADQLLDMIALHARCLRSVARAAGRARSHIPVPKHRDHGFYVRYAGDTIQLAPPFVAEKAEIDELIEAVGGAIRALDRRRSTASTATRLRR